MTIAECANTMNEIKEENPELCKKKEILEAITVLKLLNEKFMEDEAKKQPLFDEVADCPVFLQVTMKKIPPKKLKKRIKVSFPHSLVTDTTEVCLFTGDLDKRNKKAEIDPDVLHYKELLKKQGITKVTEVVTLRQLRTEYKVYEARRQLMGAYDVFLCDRKIAQCLPKLLGTKFIQKRKFPIQINMNTSNLKSQIDKALSEAVLAVTCRGNSCTFQVACLGMDKDKILENILASLKVLAEQLPGAQKNIFGIYIKTARSQAIPIFISFGNPNEVKIKKPYKREKVEAEELSTLPNATVKVFRDGKIVVKKTQDNEGNTKKFKPFKGKRKRKGNEDQNEDNLDGINAISSEKSEHVVEDVEKVANKSKSRKKRKFNEMNKDPESGAAEFVVEDLKRDSSPSKSKSKKKRKVIAENDESEYVVKHIQKDVNKSYVVGNEEEDVHKSKSKKKHKLNEKNKGQGAIEFMVEGIEKDTSLSKTKSRNKREAVAESVEPEQATVQTKGKLKLKTEEDISVIKTKLRSRGNNEGNNDLKKSSPEKKKLKKGLKKNSNESKVVNK